MEEIKMSNEERDYTTKPLERIKVKCHLCNHEWNTISDNKMVTCTSCSRKTPRLKKGITNGGEYANKERE